MALRHASPEELVIRKNFLGLVDWSSGLSDAAIVTELRNKGLISAVTEKRLQDPLSDKEPQGLTGQAGTSNGHASYSPVPNRVLKNTITILNVQKHVHNDPEKFEAFLETAKLNNTDIMTTMREEYVRYKNAVRLFDIYRTEIEKRIPDALQLSIKLYPHGIVSETVMELLANNCSGYDPRVNEVNVEILVDHIRKQINDNPAVLEKFLAVVREEAEKFYTLNFCTLSGLASEMGKKGAANDPDRLDQLELTQSSKVEALQDHEDDFVKLKPDCAKLATELYEDDLIAIYVRDYIIDGPYPEERKLKQYLFAQVKARITDDPDMLLPLLDSLSEVDGSWSESAKEIELHASIIQIQRSGNVRFQSQIIRKSTTLNWEEYGVAVDVEAEEGAIFLGCCEPNDQIIVPQEGYEFVSPVYAIAAIKGGKARSDEVEIRMESSACISSSEEELYFLHRHLYGFSAEKYQLSQLKIEGDVYKYKEDSPVPLSMKQLPALFAVARKCSSGAVNRYEAILCTPKSLDSKPWPWRAAFSVCHGIEASRQKILKQVQQCDKVDYIHQAPYPKPVSISGDTVDLRVPDKYQQDITPTTGIEIRKQDIESAFLGPREHPVIILEVNRPLSAKGCKLTVTGLKEGEQTLNEICLKQPRKKPKASKESENGAGHLLLRKSSAALVEHLAAAKCSGDLALKLRAQTLIGDTIYNLATNYAPDVTESGRIRYIVDAMVMKVQLRSRYYYDFLRSLEEIHPDYRKLVEGSGFIE